MNDAYDNAHDDREILARLTVGAEVRRLWEDLHDVSQNSVAWEIIQRWLDEQKKDATGPAGPDDRSCQRGGDEPLRATGDAPESVNHPAHYGGDTTYEAIKVIEAWGLDFCLGNAVKYVCRASKKSEHRDDLRKAAWYLAREIESLSLKKSL